MLRLTLQRDLAAGTARQRAYRRGRRARSLYLRHCRGTRDFVTYCATARSCGEQDAPLALFKTSPRHTRFCYPLRHSAMSSGGSRGALGFIRDTVRDARNHVAIDTSARYPPAAAGPLPGRDDAPLVLSVTLSAMPAFVLRLKHQRDLGAGTAR